MSILAVADLRPMAHLPVPFPPHGLRFARTCMCEETADKMDRLGAKAHHFGFSDGKNRGKQVRRQSEVFPATDG